MVYDLQKASLMKRFSAFLLDLILFIILATGFMWLISSITGYDDYSNTISEKMAIIESEFAIPAITEEYEIDLNSYSIMSDEEKSKLPQEVVTSLEDCIKAINSNKEIANIYIKMMSLMLLMVSLSLFLSTFLLEFVVPIIFKNGQTVGKKIFSIAVMRIDGVKISTVILFVRSILGKYTIETMIPAIILLMMFYGVGSIVTIAIIPLILIFQIILVATTKTNSMIHDILSSTVTVDLQSQMIFNSVKDKEEYQLRIHNEDAQNAKYF